MPFARVKGGRIDLAATQRHDNQTGTTAEREVARRQLLLRALRSRNYRLFSIGQGVSLVGTWMQE